MRLTFSMLIVLTLSSCVQDEGKISADSISNGGSSGGISGGSSGTSGGGSGSTGGGSSNDDDPLYPYQWHLNNIGQDLFTKPLYALRTYADLNDNKVRDLTEPDIDVDHNVHEVHENEITGLGVRIVVSDSGTDYTHPDLINNQILGKHRNYNFLDPNRWALDAEAFPSGNEAHGTAVTGIIAAEGWNGVGGRGIAPNAKYAAFKFIGSDAIPQHNTSNLVKLLHQLDSDTDDFDIWNMSYGFDGKNFLGEAFYNIWNGDVAGTNRNQIDQLLFSNVADPATALRGGKGAIYVQSAGNSFEEKDEDGNFEYAGNANSDSANATPYKIIVGAVNHWGLRASYSTPGANIWVAGLGGEGATANGYVPAIFTTDIRTCNAGYSFRNTSYAFNNPFNYDPNFIELNSECDYTNLMNGTSSAAPMIAGIVALMLEANPELTWRQVKYILARAADPVDYFPHLSPSWDSQYAQAAAGVFHLEDKWTVNAAGIPFSNLYGFGLVKADLAVDRAKNNPPNLGTYVIRSATAVASVNVASIAQSTIIEAVEIEINSAGVDTEDMEITLRSPSNTVSKLLPMNSGITNGNLESSLRFVTNAFLDENAQGNWTLSVDGGFVDPGFTIRIHGR